MRTFPKGTGRAHDTALLCKWLGGELDLLGPEDVELRIWSQHGFSIYPPLLLGWTIKLLGPTWATYPTSPGCNMSGSWEWRLPSSSEMDDVQHKQVLPPAPYWTTLDSCRHCENYCAAWLWVSWSLQKFQINKTHFSPFEYPRDLAYKKCSLIFSVSYFSVLPNLGRLCSFGSVERWSQMATIPHETKAAHVSSCADSLMVLACFTSFPV